MARANSVQEAPEAVAKSEAETDGEAAQRSMLNIMRDKFASEPRVKVKIHNDDAVFVQLNGYSFLIKPNVVVEVPEQVRDILDEAGYI